VVFLDEEDFLRVDLTPLDFPMEPPLFTAGFFVVVTLWDIDPCKVYPFWRIDIF